MRLPTGRSQRCASHDLSLSVRGPDGRVVAVEITGGAPARYATRRASAALADPREAGACLLTRHGVALDPRRSLLAAGVRDGDTLELVPQPAITRAAQAHDI